MCRGTLCPILSGSSVDVLLSCCRVRLSAALPCWFVARHLWYTNSLCISNWLLTLYSPLLINYGNEPAVTEHCDFIWEFQLIYLAYKTVKDKLE